MYITNHYCPVKNRAGHFAIPRSIFYRTVVIIYCDPPYYGRHADYYNGWTEEDEKKLFDLLCETKAKFVLSTWHHNDWRENEMLKKYWDKFNVLTKDHFYHNGGNIENRRKIVEALVCNFDTSKFSQHNHGAKKKREIEQLKLEW